MCRQQQLAVREVWKDNLAEELTMFRRRRLCSRYISIDAEFPGFLRSTPRSASEEERYQDVKHNVDNLKLIQLGVTLFDEVSDENSYVTWQFNLGDFDPQRDPCSRPSIDLLKKSGIDFDEFRREGVGADALSMLLPRSLALGYDPRRITKWITFHGLYDIAYLLKLITRAPLPDTFHQFTNLRNVVLGRVYDVKHMIRFCQGRNLSENMGLVRLSKALGVNWDGENHLAGHDSLLTAKVFMEMKEQFPAMKEEHHTGVLYSVEKLCLRHRQMVIIQREAHLRSVLPYVQFAPSCHPPPHCGKPVVVRQPFVSSTSWSSPPLPPLRPPPPPQFIRV